MPADHRLGAHDDQRVAPIEQSREYGQRDSRDGIDSPRFDATFDLQEELTAQKQVLAFE